MSAVGTIVAGGSLLASGLKDFSFKKTFSAISSIFKSEGCSSAETQQKKELEDAIRQYLTTSDIRYLAGLARSPVSANASSLADFFVGGGDCFHRNVNSDDQKLLDELPGLLETRIAEANQGSSQAGNNVVSGPGTIAGPGKNNMFIVLAILAAGFFFITQKGN